MLTKRTLLDYINDLDEALFTVLGRVQDLERDVEKLKEDIKPKTGGDEEKPKRGRGRPRKNA